MKGQRILRVLGNVDDQYIADLYENRDAKQKTAGRYRAGRLWLIAAILAAMVLLMGCAVAYYLSLQEMKIADTAGTQYYNESGDLVIADDAGYSVITIHGVSGSPTFLAAQEWYKFTENYDVGGEKLMEAENNPIEIPEAYEAYSIYNQEMKDKVDEIVQKYDLKLLGAFAPFQKWERKVFYEALGIDSLLTPGSIASIEGESGYFYEAGNFKVEFHMKMTEGDKCWPYNMLNTIYYSRADTFDRVYFVTDGIQKWEQWSYTTSGGAEVLIAVNASGYGAKVICNREDALIYADIENYYVTDWSAAEIGPENTIFMTKEQLEQVVDQLDFTLVVENVDIAFAKENLSRFQNGGQIPPDAIQEHNTNYEEDMDAIGVHSYEDRVKRLLENCEGFGYMLRDITGDGVEELFIGKDGRILYIYTINGNKTAHLLTNIVGRMVVTYDGSDMTMTLSPSYICLCEGHALAYVYEEPEGKVTHHFARLEDGTMVWAEEIVYDPNAETPWQLLTSEVGSNKGYNDVTVLITQEQYQEILNSYLPVDVELIPLEQFQME